MQVKLRTLMAGPAGIKQPDSILTLSDADANDLIKAGCAVAYHEKPEAAPAVPAKRERADATRRPTERADAPE